MTRDGRPLILHVIHHLVTGGMENGLVNIINRMPESKYGHAVACVEDYSEFRQRIRRPDVPVFALHRSQHGVWTLRRRLYGLCRELKPVIVHSRGLSGLDALIPALAAGVRFRVHGEHGWDTSDLRGERRKPLLVRRLHSPLVSHYVAVSRDLARYLEDRVGIAPSRITHICNGVDVERFVPRPEAGRSARMPAAFREPGSIVVGTVGRLTAVKDQATLLRGFAAARESLAGAGPRMHLAVVGGGPLHEELKALARELRIDAVTWFAGPVDDVASLMQGFDVFALPSLNEGISNTVLEALASGVPVVATRTGGNVELVDDGMTGRLIEVGDVASLARCLVAYATDEPLRRRHASAARGAAVARFSLEGMLAKYAQLYDHFTHGAALPQ
jgi:sugar transferase (PEP-CTERM/EpsH1 system associated)